MREYTHISFCVQVNKSHISLISHCILSFAAAATAKHTHTQTHSVFPTNKPANDPKQILSYDSYYTTLRILAARQTDKTCSDSCFKHTQKSVYVFRARFSECFCARIFDTALAFPTNKLNTHTNQQMRYTMGDLDTSLIQEFANRPAFYNKTSPHYKDKLYIEQAWLEISAKLGYDGMFGLYAFVWAYLYTFNRCWIVGIRLGLPPHRASSRASGTPRLRADQTNYTIN